MLSRVDGAQVEVTHLLTCRAIALVDANGFGLVVVCGRKFELDLVLHVAAMT